MSQKTLHLLYSIVLSVMLVVAGICLCIACVGIYLSGDKPPFSPEAVADAFAGIAIPVYLCLALVILGFVLDGFLPDKKKKPSLQKQYAGILARLYEKADMRYAAPNQQATISALQKERKLYKAITLVLLAASTVVFLAYSLNIQNFHKTEINGSMVKAMSVFVPCLGVPFLWAIVGAYLERKSIIAEIAIVKQIVSSGATSSEITPKKTSRAFPLILRYGILAAGIAFVICGLLNGGTQDVLTKAINICTECVGLG